MSVVVYVYNCVVDMDLSVAPGSPNGMTSPGAGVVHRPVVCEGEPAGPSAHSAAHSAMGRAATYTGLVAYSLQSYIDSKQIQS